jgi:hypothetical protein
VQRRKKTEKDGRDAGRGEEKGADFKVDVDLVAEDNSVGEIALKQLESYVSEFEAERAAGEAEQKALRKELPYKTATLCTERGAQGELAAAVVPAREQEASNVGAGDEPYGEDGDVECDDGRTRGTGDDVGISLQADGICVFVFGVFMHELFMNGIYLVGGLCHGDTGTQAADDAEHAGRTVMKGLFVGRDRGPNRVVSRVGGKSEAVRHNTDDGVGNAIDGDGAGQDRGVGIVDLPPRHSGRLRYRDLICRSRAGRCDPSLAWLAEDRRDLSWKQPAGQVWGLTCCPR